MRTMRKQWLWSAGLVVWAALVTVGLAGITRYAATPGRPAHAAAEWPREVPFSPTDRALTLVLSIHPRCPCSRATMAELSRLMARHSGKLSAYVLMTKPSCAPADWELGAIMDAAKRIPSVRVMTDQDGEWSQRFGASTSGQTFAFDSDGRLLFSGGITASRGHEGDNAGSDAIGAILAAGKNDRPATPPPSTTPVFGCALKNCVRTER